MSELMPAPFGASVAVADLAAALKLAKRIIERRASTPILATALLRPGPAGLELVATDLETWARFDVPAALDPAADAGPGLAIDPFALADILAKLKAGKGGLASLQFDYAGGRLEIGHGRARSRLAALKAADYPAWPDAFPLASVTMPAADLAADLAAVAPAIATDSETRYWLRGAMIEFNRAGVTFAATDGIRLAVIDKAAAVTGAAPATLPMPGAAVAVAGHCLAKREGPAVLAWCATEGKGGRRWRLTFPGGVLESKAIECDPVQWRRVVGQALDMEAAAVPFVDLDPLLPADAIAQLAKAAGGPVMTWAGDALALLECASRPDWLGVTIRRDKPAYAAGYHNDGYVKMESDGQSWPVAVGPGGKIHLSAETVRAMCGDPADFPRRDIPARPVSYAGHALPPGWAYQPREVPKGLAGEAFHRWRALNPPAVPFWVGEGGHGARDWLADMAAGLIIAPRGDNGGGGIWQDDGAPMAADAPAAPEIRPTSAQEAAAPVNMPADAPAAASGPDIAPAPAIDPAPCPAEAAAAALRATIGDTGGRVVVLAVGRPRPVPVATVDATESAWSVRMAGPSPLIPRPVAAAVADPEPVAADPGPLDVPAAPYDPNLADNSLWWVHDSGAWKMGPSRRRPGFSLLVPLDSVNGYKGAASYLAEECNGRWHKRSGGYLLSLRGSNRFVAKWNKRTAAADPAPDDGPPVTPPAPADLPPPAPVPVPAGYPIPHAPAVDALPADAGPDLAAVVAALAAQVEAMQARLDAIGGDAPAALPADPMPATADNSAALADMAARLSDMEARAAQWQREAESQAAAADHWQATAESRARSILALCSRRDATAARLRAARAAAKAARADAATWETMAGEAESRLAPALASLAAAESAKADLSAAIARMRATAPLAGIRYGTIDQGLRRWASAA